ncbi:hsp90 co-chaperone Cdc37 [Paragonimus heterotremus]|uniref:Hsp90 co-chaperone Cdc37 n=1 Tax=Paragonimus heterotremus TaxID=100268 RepID=A0A8J4WF45_9TREM|nr:hsp90 co-chaperone Cdc37 [Paragonimus heterotremus]
MAKLDYSKWDHIEVSDDEDDTHPNIDTPSLFRWRHQARLERDEAWRKEKAEFEGSYKAFLQKYNTCQQKLAEAKQSNSADLPELMEQMKQLEKEDQEWQPKVEEFKKKDRLRPWNIDTICREGKSKTIINSAALKHEEAPPTDDSEEAAINRLKDFVNKHNKDIRRFGLFQKPLDSQNCLLENPFLVCEETANQLVLWCIDLAMEEVGVSSLSLQFNKYHSHLSIDLQNAFCVDFFFYYKADCMTSFGGRIISSGLACMIVHNFCLSIMRRSF